MEKTSFELVKEFHKTFGHLINKVPTQPEDKIIRLRLALILEEFIELFDACVGETSLSSLGYVHHLKNLLDELYNGQLSIKADIDLVEVADALGDIKYVTDGAAICFGLPFDAIFKEIHRSNMSKLGEDGKPIYREDGKVMKGPDFSPPDIKKILEREKCAADLQELIDKYMTDDCPEYVYIEYAPMDGRKSSDASYALEITDGEFKGTKINIHQIVVGDALDDTGDGLVNFDYEAVSENPPPKDLVTKILGSSFYIAIQRGILGNL